jgi:hypothetical protein
MSELKKFPIEIPIPAASLEEAQEKAKGLFVLAQILQAEHLTETVKFIREKPKLAQMLNEKPLDKKKVLEIVEYLGLWGMIKDLLNPFKKSN